MSRCSSMAERPRL